MDTLLTISMLLTANLDYLQYVMSGAYVLTARFAPTLKFFYQLYVGKGCIFVFCQLDVEFVYPVLQLD